MCKCWVLRRSCVIFRTVDFVKNDWVSSAFGNVYIHKCRSSDPKSNKLSDSERKCPLYNPEIMPARIEKQITLRARLSTFNWEAGVGLFWAHLGNHAFRTSYNILLLLCWQNPSECTSITRQNHIKVGKLGSDCKFLIIQFPPPKTFSWLPYMYSGSQEKFGTKTQCKILHDGTLRGGHLNSEKPVGFCYPACMGLPWNI